MVFNRMVGMLVLGLVLLMAPRSSSLKYIHHFQTCLFELEMLLGFGFGRTIRLDSYFLKIFRVYVSYFFFCIMLRSLTF